MLLYILKFFAIYALSFSNIDINLINISLSKLNELFSIIPSLLDLSKIALFFTRDINTEPCPCALRTVHPPRSSDTATGLALFLDSNPSQSNALDPPSPYGRTQKLSL